MLILNIAHNKALDLINAIYDNKANYYLIFLFYSVIFTSCFILSFFIENYFFRVIFMSIINGSGGLLHPLISYMKSHILVEKYRALLMNFFLIPSNILLVMLYLLAKKLNNSEIICLFNGGLSFVMIIGGLLLYLKEKEEELLDRKIRIKSNNKNNTINLNNDINSIDK